MKRLLMMSKQGFDPVHSLLQGLRKIRLKQSSNMKTFCFGAVILLSSIVYGQRNNDRNELENRVISVQIELDAVNNKINNVSDRLVTIPAGQVDPSVTEQLELMKESKSKLEAIIHSINHYLNGGSVPPVDVKIISQEQFELYPEENKEQILAHPERYLVLNY